MRERQISIDPINTYLGMPVRQLEIRFLLYSPPPPCHYPASRSLRFEEKIHAPRYAQVIDKRYRSSVLTIYDKPRECYSLVISVIVTRGLSRSLLFFLDNRHSFANRERTVSPSRSPFPLTCNFALTEEKKSITCLSKNIVNQYDL